MRSIQSGLAFPLAAVKPLDDLEAYRAQCVAATRQALATGAKPRRDCPACETALAPVGDVDGLAYGRCGTCGSIALLAVTEAGAWRALLHAANGFRRAPSAFHRRISESRIETVYAPKLDWIRGALRMHGVTRPRLVEATTPPSDFTPMLSAADAFGEVAMQDEMDLAHGAAGPAVDVVLLLESLDRVDDPARLVRAAAARLSRGGLVFVTALVWSGFDLAVLGLRNRYLYPPDRATCFTLAGLERLLERAGFDLVEASTPGVLDVEIVAAHLRHDPSLRLSDFERRLVEADAETRQAFQAFLQERRLSSFARLMGRLAR